ALFASENHGRPAVAATAKPGEFSGRGVVTAKAAGAPYRAPAMSPKEARAPASAENRPAQNRPASPSGAKAAGRPFVPPNKANTANRPEGGNATRENARPSSEPRAESRPSPAPKARE